MRVFRYQLPLKRAIQLGQFSIRQREGILLEREGRWAEAAPLPGFSSESIDDVLQAIRGDSPQPASLRFALDALKYDASPCHVPVNALLQGTPEENRIAAKTLSVSACQAVKLKVGRLDVKTEVELVRDVGSILRTEQTLRLDANRAWDWDTACEFADGVTGISIEYIEEPLRDASRLDEFTSATSVSYALDESLVECTSLASYKKASACIVKPTILGDRKRIEAIRKLGKPLVFSSCYESGVGIIQLSQLASQLSPNIPAGFDTYNQLAVDVLQQRLEIHDWRIHIPSRVDVNVHVLEELHL